MVRPPDAPSSSDCPSGTRYNVAVAPTSWRFGFSSERHIENLELWTENFYHCFQFPRELSWDVFSNFSDENPTIPDDRYRWGFKYTIAEMYYSFMHYGESPFRSEYPNTSEVGTYQESFQSDELKCYEEATVILRGWRFNFLNGDHHLKKVEIIISDVAYDPETGTITWSARANFRDKDADDPFMWRYQWLIIACSDCDIFETTIADTPLQSLPGNTLRYSNPISLPDYRGELEPRISTAIFLQGWRLTLANIAGDDDLKVMSLGVGLENTTLSLNSTNVRIMGDAGNSIGIFELNLAGIAYDQGQGYFTKEWPDDGPVHFLYGYFATNPGRNLKIYHTSYTKATLCSHAQDH
jgi:hypothetical protein